MGAGTAPLLSVFGAVPWRFFNPNEAALVDALCEQIIPGDDSPGAHDLLVVRFVDKQLMGVYSRFQAEYRNGLIGVDETSQSLHQKRFLDLEFEKQTDIMRALESDRAPGDAWKTQSANGFFNLLRNHAIQGFYGSPRHGGNRSYGSYRMLGLDYPQIIGQNRYR
jgi:gluconate 2-dehydrogenase gamma chain